MSVAEEVEGPELSTGKHQDPKLTVVPDSPTTANQESGYSPEHPWYTGGGALEDIAGIAGAVESKSWLDGGLSGLSLVADTASMFFDPLGTALSWGVAMIMDHCDPLRSWLQKLAGNQDDVSAKANTWRNVACALEENAKRMDANVASFTQYSRGQAANSFAESAGGVNALIVGAAQGARVLSQGLEILAGVVEVVYSMVRDAISQIVGTFISAVIQALLTAGLALAKLIPEISVKVSAWVSKLWGHIDSLLSSAGKLVTLFKSGGDLIASMVKKIKNGLKAGFGKGMLPRRMNPDTLRKAPSVGNRSRALRKTPILCVRVRIYLTMCLTSPRMQFQKSRLRILDGSRALRVLISYIIQTMFVASGTAVSLGPIQSGSMSIKRRIWMITVWNRLGMIGHLMTGMQANGNSLRLQSIRPSTV